MVCWAGLRRTRALWAMMPGLCKVGCFEGGRQGGREGGRRGQERGGDIMCVCVYMCVCVVCGFLIVEFGILKLHPHVFLIVRQDRDYGF